MHEMTTSATIVDPASLGADAFTAVLPRSELETAFTADTPAGLWLELAQEGFDEPTRLTIDLQPDDLEEILGLTTDDEIALAFDDSALASLFGDAEVEAHGMGGGLALAVVAAERATTSVSAQRASLAVSPQVASLATKAQVSAQVSKGAAKKAQISAAKASGLRLLKIGIVR